MTDNSAKYGGHCRVVSGRSLFVDAGSGENKLKRVIKSLMRGHYNWLKDCTYIDGSKNLQKGKNVIFKYTQLLSIIMMNL
ncbi:MAG: hypothetical protein Ta2C_08110 [Candidatus Endomicrobiellum trichonymphae]|nr:MAG: hypothetical protein Ta2C_08110 [Candidatus Endomicrobium trichonymphae]